MKKKNQTIYLTWTSAESEDQHEDDTSEGYWDQHKTLEDAVMSGSGEVEVFQADLIPLGSFTLERVVTKVKKKAKAKSRGKKESK